MISRLRLLAWAGLGLLAARLPAQDPNFYVFLCFGQSNMEGYPGILDEDKTLNDPRFQVLAAVDFADPARQQGQWYPALPPLCRPNAGISPADYFGRTLVANLPSQINVGVVNVSVAGCKIELFDRDHFADYAATAPSWMQDIITAYGGNPYARLVAMAKLAQKKGIIKGILLHQGESNSGDPTWPAKVKAVYENLLQDLNLTAAEVPLIAGEVVAADQQGATAGMNEIIATLPDTIPTAHVVSSVGCPSLPDHLHFTPAGYRELGRRYAQAVLALLDVPMGNPDGQPVLIRAIGPTLSDFGINNAFADPRMTLFAAQTPLAQNDDWSLAPNAAAIASTTQTLGGFSLDESSRDAALLIGLDPGPHSAHVTGPADASGVVLLELYNTGTQRSRLVNLSSLAVSGRGENVLTTGFALAGNGAKTLLIRAVGPTLAQFGVGNTLANPILTLYRGTTPLFTNDDWNEAPDVAALQAASETVGAFTLPAQSHDAAMLVTLMPGIYSAQASGIAGTTGNVIIEVYALP